MASNEISVNVTVEPPPREPHAAKYRQGDAVWVKSAASGFYFPARISNITAEVETPVAIPPSLQAYYLQYKHMRVAHDIGIVFSWRYRYSLVLEDFPNLRFEASENELVLHVTADQALDRLRLDEFSGALPEHAAEKATHA